MKDGVSLGEPSVRGSSGSYYFSVPNAFHSLGQPACCALNVMKNRETIVGTITELPPRRPVVASYEVNGQRYTTEILALRLSIPSLDQLRVGDRVTTNTTQTHRNLEYQECQKLLLLDLKDVAFIGVFLVFAAAYFEFNIRVLPQVPS